MIRHHFGTHEYAKEVCIPAGQVLVQHKHQFDHLSILAQGSVELMVDGEVSVVHAPTCLTIPAGKHHGLKALTDTVWFCIHATDCKDVEKIDELLIVPGDINEAQQIALSLEN